MYDSIILFFFVPFWGVFTLQRTPNPKGQTLCDRGLSADTSLPFTCTTPFCISFSKDLLSLSQVYASTKDTRWAFFPLLWDEVEKPVSRRSESATKPTRSFCSSVMPIKWFLWETNRYSWTLADFLLWIIASWKREKTQIQTQCWSWVSSPLQPCALRRAEPPHPQKR